MTIKANIEHNQLEKVYQDILSSINSIEQIDISEDDALASSGLISMLVSLKQSNENIKIPLLDDENCILNSLGKFSVQV